jgi:hypothetical protein
MRGTSTLNLRGFLFNKIMDEQKLLKFLEYFSVITIGENKIPNFHWKEQQTEKLSEEQFLRQLKTHQQRLAWVLLLALNFLK